MIVRTYGAGDGTKAEETPVIDGPRPLIGESQIFIYYQLNSHNSAFYRCNGHRHRPCSSSWCSFHIDDTFSMASLSLKYEI
jgi:hypothetical protein